MSYLDPQRWGDVDYMGNALDWSNRKAKLLYPGYEMLRLAMVERCQATGTVIPAVLQTARAPGRIYTGGWFTNFHNTISTLIPKFVNHLDHEGDWDNIFETVYPPVACAPHWTEATILTAMGDAARIAAPYMPLGEWSLQQYKILNLLVWSSTHIISNWEARIGEDWLSTFSMPVSWQRAVDQYLAKTWGDAPAVPNVDVHDTNSCCGRGFKHYLGDNPNYAFAGVVRARYKLGQGSPSPQANFNRVFDCYMHFGRWHPGPPGSGAHFDVDFDNEGLPISEQTWYRWQTDDGPYIGTSAAYCTDWFGSIEAITPEPLEPGAGEYNGLGWMTDGTKLVVKWDLLGSFKFVDK